MEKVEGGRDMERGTWKGCVCVCGSCAAASEGWWSKSTDKQSIKLTWTLFSPSLTPPFCFSFFLIPASLPVSSPTQRLSLLEAAFPIVQTWTTNARFHVRAGCINSLLWCCFFFCFFCSLIKSGAELQIALGSLGEIQSNQ